PTNPIATPASREPVTRTSWKATNAISALKIGTAAWMIDASPESIRVSPHDRSQNGIVVFTSATTTSQRQCSRSWRRVSPVLTTKGATRASVTAARPSRPRISVAGVSSRTATLMNRNDAPQIRASAISITRLRLTGRVLHADYTQLSDEGLRTVAASGARSYQLRVRPNL